MTDAHATGPEGGMVSRLERLIRESSILESISSGDRVAVKPHMGEAGNTTHVRPVFVKTVVDMVKEVGGDPFVTDTTVIYGRRRMTGSGYIEVARENGFYPDGLGCPIIIADGENGDEGTTVHGEWNSLSEMEVAQAVYDADAMIAITHVTGHGRAGLGGGIKNLAMGCVTKKGKIDQHCVMKPSFNKEECIACGSCVENCPAGAIYIDETAVFNVEECYGCEMCEFICESGAWKPQIENIPEFQTRLADAAAAVISTFAQDKIAYINFALDVTWHCDCTDFSDRPVVPDIGILASKDPLSIDQASWDLVNASPGVPGTLAERLQALQPDTEKMKMINKVDCEHQLSAFENLELGERSYQIIEIG